MLPWKNLMPPQGVMPPSLGISVLKQSWKAMPTKHLLLSGHFE
jgi:hypothetical protein